MGKPSLQELEPPSIEQLAIDLRRLDRQRSREGQPERWGEEVLIAYDARLQLACRAAGISESLAAFEGADRDVERVRVEAALQAEGLEFRYRADAADDLPDVADDQVGDPAPTLLGGTPREPVQSINSLIGSVVLVLPSKHRERYLEEFRSELYEVTLAGASRWQQLWYALRLFDRAWVLSAELREAALRRSRS